MAFHQNKWFNSHKYYCCNFTVISVQLNYYYIIFLNFFWLLRNIVRNIVIFIVLFFSIFFLVVVLVVFISILICNHKILHHWPVLQTSTAIPFKSQSNLLPEKKIKIQIFTENKSYYLASQAFNVLTMIRYFYWEIRHTGLKCAATTLAPQWFPSLYSGCRSLK